MIRILLPLAIVAAIFFGPMFAETTSGSATGDRKAIVSGEYFIGEAIGCLMSLKPPIGEECASDGKINDSLLVGNVLTWASLLSIAAAIIGVLGLLPFIGRLTSIVTIAAGGFSLGAIGLFMLTMMATPEGLPGVQWGAYLAAGAALLTTISGLSGMRGR